jgi:hypothetical protein
MLAIVRPLQVGILPLVLHCYATLFKHVLARARARARTHTHTQRPIAFFLSGEDVCSRHSSNEITLWPQNNNCHHDLSYCTCYNRASSSRNIFGHKYRSGSEISVCIWWRHSVFVTVISLLCARCLKCRAMAYAASRRPLTAEARGSHPGQSMWDLWWT